jgi:propanol-preferring alcohol dehydrogenase
MNGKMKAAVLKQFCQPFAIEEMNIPTPGPNEALVKVMASGLCLTDIHIRDGIFASVCLPYIPGHEMAGVVAALGEKACGHGLEVGQHVVCGIDITCGTCKLCRLDRENLCLNRVRVGFERNGSHAQYAVVPWTNLHPIQGHVPFEQAAVIPDAVACMFHAIRTQAGVCEGDRVLIYGAGGLGLQGVQIAKHFGAWVCAASRTHQKLALALELGADETVNTRQEDLCGAVDRLTCGEKFDAVFDLVGYDDSIDLLLHCVRPGGKVIALAYAEDSFSMNCQELVIKEKEVLGLRGATTKDLIETIDLVERGVIVPCVSKRYALEEINFALEDLREGKTMGRSVILFE